MGHLVVQDRQTQLINRARRALAEAATLKQIKAVIDTAAAAELYAKRQRLSDETVGYAHALQIDALAKLGGMLRKMPKHVGGRPSRTGSQVEPVTTLSDLGISKKLSMVAQRLSRLPAAMRRAVAAREQSMRQAIISHRQATAVRPPLPAGKYRVLYADPPWAPNHKGDYPTMSLEEICALDVKSIAAADAVLFLWTTSPMLLACAPVIAAWGFEYKTQIVWDKETHVVGHYVSVQHENLLVCTRGNCQPDRLTPMLSSVLRVHRSPRRHSEKPAEARKLIERLYDGPRIELFARHVTPGWATFGNDPALRHPAA